MPLIACPDCGREVSDAAPTCLGCGRPMAAAGPIAKPKAPRGKKHVVRLLLVLACLGAVATIALVFAERFGVNITAECGVNGFGMGRCDFTNRGWWGGSKCAIVQVIDNRGLGAPVQSRPVCSGNLGRLETRNVSFDVAGVQRLCSPSAADMSEDGPGRKQWDQYCSVHTTSAPN